MFGYFYWALLGFFVEQGQRMMGLQGGPTQNVNEQMIRPVFMNASVLLLFMLPLITMRTYSEEKRSGTIELLLTSPVTDFQIIMGKFVGAMALYAAMLGVTLIHMGVLWAFGSPEWKPLATGYLGMLLMGGCFISVGLLISSFTRNQIIAGAMTFAVFLLLWVVNWVGPFMGPADAGCARLPLDHQSPGRLHARDHRHPPPCLLRELHGVRVVPDGALGRHRAVERVTL
jgi:ABC-2 type transport system permease protein